MISSVNVLNLKCFKHVIIPLSQLTLLAGFNAAGKSTIIQSLLLASQMLRSNTRYSSLILNVTL